MIPARKRVLAIPPDFTRFHSRAGEITRYAFDFYGAQLTDILPALGTHSPMTSEQIHEMFPGVPESLFRVHNWRTGITTVGTERSMMREISLADRPSAEWRRHWRSRSVRRGMAPTRAGASKAA